MASFRIRAARPLQIPVGLWANAYEALMDYVRGLCVAEANKHSAKLFTESQKIDAQLWALQRASKLFEKKQPVKLGNSTFTFEDLANGKVRVFEDGRAYDTVNANALGHYGKSLADILGEGPREERAELDRLNTTIQAVRDSGVREAGSSRTVDVPLPAGSEWPYPSPMPSTVKLKFFADPVSASHPDQKDSPLLGQYNPADTSVQVGGLRDAVYPLDSGSWSTENFPINSHVLRDRVSTLRHELGHWLQDSFKSKKGRPGGLPRARYDNATTEAHAPHSLRDIEFYPNLSSEYDDYLIRGYGLSPRQWIARSRRFNLLREQDPEKFKKMVNGFLRLVEEQPELPGKQDYELADRTRLQQIKQFSEIRDSIRQSLDPAVLAAAESWKSGGLSDDYKMYKSLLPQHIDEPTGLPYSRMKKNTVILDRESGSGDNRWRVEWLDHAQESKFGLTREKAEDVYTQLVARAVQEAKWALEDLDRRMDEFSKSAATIDATDNIAGKHTLRLDQVRAGDRVRFSAPYELELGDAILTVREHSLGEVEGVDPNASLLTVRVFGFIEEDGRRKQAEVTIDVSRSDVALLLPSDDPRIN